MPEASVIPGFLSIAPRIWEGSGRAEVVQHRLAGVAELPEISDWKRFCWFLPRAAAERQQLPMPESRLVGAPRLQVWLAQARLVQVEDGVAHRAIKAGEQAIFLAYHRVGGGGALELHQGATVRGFSCEDAALYAAAFGEEEDEEEGGYGHDVAALYDRILAVLSAGELSLYDVDLALMA